MTTITTKNALTMRDSLRKSLFANEEASTADVEDGARSPVDKPNADAVAVPDKDAPLEKKDSLDEGKKDGDGVAASEESKTTVKAEAKVTETVATPAPDAETKTPEEVDWHKKFLQMERQFKSIQSSITPTQQDNSRLRDEIAALRAKLGESANSETKPKLDAKNLSEALKAIHETFPEGADLIEIGRAHV